MRGNHLLKAPVVVGPGSIPRACGGTVSFWTAAWPSRGLSPRVRGNRVRLEIIEPHQGSIPARAGGTDADDGDKRGEYGLSPRVRGNPEYALHRPGEPGSIPARAGEPLMSMGTVDSVRVYPRACGGTLLRPATTR